MELCLGNSECTRHTRLKDEKSVLRNGGQAANMKNVCHTQKREKKLRSKRSRETLDLILCHKDEDPLQNYKHLNYLIQK